MATAAIEVANVGGSISALISLYVYVDISSWYL